MLASLTRRIHTPRGSPGLKQDGFAKTSAAVADPREEQSCVISTEEAESGAPPSAARLPRSHCNC